MYFPDLLMFHIFRGGGGVYVYTQVRVQQCTRVKVTFSNTPWNADVDVIPWLRKLFLKNLVWKTVVEIDKY